LDKYITYIPNTNEKNSKNLDNNELKSTEYCLPWMTDNILYMTVKLNEINPIVICWDRRKTVVINNINYTNCATILEATTFT